MPRPALFVVKATIAPEREAAFNEWYNTRRAAEAAEVRGLIAMRRYSEEALRAFAASDTEARFGGAGDRVRFTYRQVFP